MVLKNRLKTKKLAKAWAKIERKKGLKATIKQVKTPMGKRYGLYTYRKKTKK